MPRTYSLYAAKAKLSEIVRRVREGDIVTISEERGVIVGSGKPRGKLRPIARRPGALKRFLAERD